MSIAASSVKGNSGLQDAHNLALMGVPIFRCRLDDDGNPEGRLANNWQRTEPGEASFRAIELWEPGMALCAVTGPVFDVIDVDPRNGGAESWPALLARLADDPPLIFGMAATPSRGAHFWIAAQNVAKTKLMKGIDLQARGGFVFIAPTMRPSKADGDNGALRPYSWVLPVHWQATPWYHRPSLAFGELPWAQPSANGSGSRRRGRRSPEDLIADVLAAEVGEQRGALLLLVQEWEMRGLGREAIKDTLRNFLPRVPCYDETKGPWYPAKGGNPDRWINGLLSRSGRIIPDADPDELEGINDVIPNRVYEPDPEEIAFWESRPILRHILDWSRARLASPWAVLGEAMAGAICRTPPTFQLPPTTGGNGTLNMLIALVGKSGAGKNAASETAEAAFKWSGVKGMLDTVGTEMVPRIPLGSGEGLAKSFGYNHRDKESGRTELVRTADSVIVTIPEIDTFAAINARSGATISPELRKLYSGETLGFGWADISKRVIIPKYSYRAVVIAGVQPGRGETILNDIDGGFAQRWLWLPATDPNAPDGVIDDPPVIEWEPPGLIPSLAHSDGPHLMRVFDGAAGEMRSARLRELRGETDDMESHSLYTRLKVAAGLALLDGQDQIRESDWELSAYVMSVSKRTRLDIQKHLAQKAHEANLAQGRAEGVRQRARDNTAETQFNTDIAKRVMAILADGEWISYNALSKRIYQKYREALRDVLAMLIELGRIESENVVYQGRKGVKYRKVRRVDSDG